MAVELVLPGVLADLAGGRQVKLEVPRSATVGSLLNVVADQYPALYRRLCDETGVPRRFVNIYVDGTDIRQSGGVTTPLPSGATVQILPSIAGG
jgi:sulfur-carrier protein